MKDLTKLVKEKVNIIKEGAWVIVGQIIVAIINLISLRILTEIAPGNILGEATLWLGILSLLKNIFISPIGNVQLRYHSEYSQNKIPNWFTNRISRLFLNLIIICNIIFIIIYLGWTKYNKLTFKPTLLIILILYFIIDAVKNLRINRLSAERKQFNIALWSTSEGVLVNGGFILLLLISVSINNYILGQVMGLLLGSMLFGFIFYPKYSDHDEKKYDLKDKIDLNKKIIKYGLPFIPLAFLSWIFNLGDRYFLGIYKTSLEVGLYTAAYSIASRPFIMANTMLSSFMRPILFQAESSNQSLKAKKVLYHWLIISCIIGFTGVIAFYFLGSVMAVLLLAKNYRPMAPTIFIWVGMGYAFFGLSQVIENYLYSKSFSRKVVIPSIINALINVTANILLIPKYGIIGAAISTAISFFMQFIIISYIAKNTISIII